MGFHKQDLETEELYYKDYVNFGRKRYGFFVKTMQEKYLASRDVLDKKLVYVEVNSYLSKTLEDFGAHCFAFHKAKTESVALIRTLVTYKPNDAKIYLLIKGKTDREIELLFGLNNIIKTSLNIKTKRRKAFVDNFVKNIKMFAIDQLNNHKIYNKAKHANVIASSIKAINPSSTDLRDSIAVLNNDINFPNVAPFSDAQFESMCRNIIIVSDSIMEIVYIYLAKYNPEAGRAIKNKLQKF